MIEMMLQANRDALLLWRRSAETMFASAFVIGQRSRIMLSGRPAAGADLAELGLMVPEKLAAFGLANLALAEAWWAGSGASWAATAAKALEAIHERATGNARRLRRRRKR